MKGKSHLPLFGVGPVIIALQILITAVGIFMSYRGYFDVGKTRLLNIPLKMIGAGLILLGFYLNYSAKRKSKLFEMVAKNKLITTGVYSVVRNPVYSAVLLACTGAVGDALGYPVEFIGEKAIFSQYGDKGIQKYELDPVSGKALISDDTQMTLFTAKRPAGRGHPGTYAGNSRAAPQLCS